MSDIFSQSLKSEVKRVKYWHWALLQTWPLPQSPLVEHFFTTASDKVSSPVILSWSEVTSDSSECESERYFLRQMLFEQVKSFPQSSLEKQNWGLLESSFRISWSIWAFSRLSRNSWATYFSTSSSPYSSYKARVLSWQYPLMHLVPLTGQCASTLHFNWVIMLKRSGAWVTVSSMLC